MVFLLSLGEVIDKYGFSWNKSQKDLMYYIEFLYNIKREKHVIGFIS